VRPVQGDRSLVGKPSQTAQQWSQLGQPKAWTIGRLWRAAGRPAISLRTLHRRSARSPAGGGPAWSPRATPDRDQILADLHHAIAKLPDGAVLLAEDETHINLLPWVRATWIPLGSGSRS
jgi:hypothetical protein